MKRSIISVLLSLGLGSLAAASEIALVQYNADAHFGDYAYNLKQLTGFADQAVAKGSKVIIFPEGSIYGYADANSVWCGPGIKDHKCKDVRKAAEAIPQGRTTTYWEHFASKHNVYLVFNIPEVEANTYFNTSAVVGPQGFVTKYRKRALYTTDEFYAEPGNLGPVTFTTPIGTFGILICMDANYPELFEEYRNMGIDRIVIQMDWDQDPNGLNGGRPARLFFQTVAQHMRQDLFISDVSPWDGTGAYLQNQRVRERNGLPAIAIGVDGVTYHHY